MTVILGINAFHADSAACLVIDGAMQSAVSEERLGGREKHCARFPENAIRHILKEAGLKFKDVTHIAIPRNPHANVMAKVGYVLSHPIRSAGAVVEHVLRNTKARGMLAQLARICDADPQESKAEVVLVEHHLAHIASAYYLSPFDGLTAGFSYDASGDFVSSMSARCEGHRIKILDRVCLPHSLGFFYTALCQFIGFDEFGEEYKVMGLSAYGEDRYAELMRELVTLEDGAWFRLKPGFFGMHEGGESGAVDTQGRIIMGRLYTDGLRGRLGVTRKRGDPVTQREMDIAKSAQVRFEEAAVHCMIKLHSLVRTEHLAMSGGCALNGVANARILRDTPFSKAYLQAAASDDGTCLGAAYYVWHMVLGRKERYHMSHSFWGPEYSEARLRQAAQSSGLPVRSYMENELQFAAVRLLTDGRIVGWYQGRSEWGPRALGHRSILANPTLAHMKDTINAKIKRRESFRPFAPSVLKECVSTYFAQDVESPFMMHVVKFKPEWLGKLPAVTHVDGTGRLQSVERASNPKYYDLIKAFQRQTGCGMVLNTSFNENEPIVDTPEQAIDCFKRTDMDALCMGNLLFLKPEINV